MMKLKALHQIEMTSRCNLRCKYCVHPTMQRAKIDMTEDIYFKTLELVGGFVRGGTQNELNLAGIGESTMHPNFAEWVMAARAAVGWRCFLVLSTNGVGLMDETIEAIAQTKINVWVSPHRPEKAMASIKKLKEVGLFQGVSEGAWTASVDWAGQIDWPITAGSKGDSCPWVPNGRGAVLSDGRISTCCFDSDGCSVVGTVDDLVVGEDLYVKPYKLCGACHHTTPKEITNFNLEKINYA